MGIAEKPLTGLKLIFTGALERFTRDEAEELVGLVSLLRAAGADL